MTICCWAKLVAILKPIKARVIDELRPKTRAPSEKQTGKPSKKVLAKRAEKKKAKEKEKPRVKNAIATPKYW